MMKWLLDKVLESALWSSVLFGLAGGAFVGVVLLIVSSLVAECCQCP